MGDPFSVHRLVRGAIFLEESGLIQLSFDQKALASSDAER